MPLEDGEADILAEWFQSLPQEKRDMLDSAFWKAINEGLREEDPKIIELHERMKKNANGGI